MPHKHTRRPGQKADGDHNLPPSALARSLPTGKQPSSNAPAKKRKRTDAAVDDTPKAFARILKFQRTGQRPNGLDDGDKPSKKKKRKLLESGKTGGAEVVDAEPRSTTSRDLKLLPGERLSEFSARVNRSLPLSGLNQKGKKVDGIKERQTRLQKKITKRQDAWRKEDERRREKVEESRDFVEEEEADEVEYWRAGGRQSKRKRRLGDMGVLADDDPWEQLRAKREKPGGLNDVVLAPPNFKKLPTEKFKDNHRKDQSSTVGGLRRMKFLVR